MKDSHLRLLFNGQEAEEVQQELALKFQEWLASRSVTSLLEAELSDLEQVREALDSVALSTATAAETVESEFNGVLRSSPLLGYDVTGNAIVRLAPAWLQRADDLFQDLDSEGRGYLIPDSLCYFALALRPARDPQEVRSALASLFSRLLHCQGQVSRIGFKVYLLRFGHGSVQAVTTLQVRIKQMARVWNDVKNLASKCDGSLLSFCNHIAHAERPFPSLIEQSIQLALPPSYADYAATVEFLRLQLPGSLLGDRSCDFVQVEETVERLAVAYTGGISESVILVFCKTVAIFNRLVDETLSILLGKQSPPASHSNARTAKHSPQRADSSEKTTIRMSPGYSRQTVASALKNVRNSGSQPPGINSLLSTGDHDTIPRVRLAIGDLHRSRS